LQIAFQAVEVFTETLTHRLSVPERAL